MEHACLGIEDEGSDHRQRLIGSFVATGDGEGGALHCGRRAGDATGHAIGAIGVGVAFFRPDANPVVERLHGATGFLTTVLVSQPIYPQRARRRNKTPSMCVVAFVGEGMHSLGSEIDRYLVAGLEAREINPDRDGWRRRRAGTSAQEKGRDGSQCDRAHGKPQLIAGKDAGNARCKPP